MFLNAISFKSYEKKNISQHISYFVSTALRTIINSYNCERAMRKLEGRGRVNQTYFWCPSPRTNLNLEFFIIII